MTHLLPAPRKQVVKIFSDFLYFFCFVSHFLELYDIKYYKSTV